MVEKERLPTPLERNIETLLEKEQVASLELTADDVCTVMQLFSEQLLEKNGASGISFQEVSVVIHDQIADISVTVTVQRPVKATFAISHTLSNSISKPGNLQVSNLTVDIQAGRLARLSLKALQVEKQIHAILANLNDFLVENPPPIVAEQGIAFSDIHMHLENTYLAVQLRSNQQGE